MLEEVERVHMDEALRMTEGHGSEAARFPGIGRGLMRRKMEHYGLSANQDAPR